MRLLLLSTQLNPVPPLLYGGIERIVGTLLNALRERGYEVGLIAHPESTATCDYFAPWPTTCPNSIGSHTRNLRAVMQSVASFRPQIIHSFTRLLYLLPLLAQDTKKIMSFGAPLHGRRTQVAAFLGGRSLTFTGCSEFVANAGRKHGGIWHAIPNFIDTDLYQFAPSVAADAPLVFLSRLDRVKGPAIAIDVAKRSGRRLVIAGNYAEQGPDAEYWHESIKPEIGRNGIEYIGPVNDAQKNELLRTAAGLIVPIQWDEPFGIVFVEALACGTPIISCPRGALPEIVQQGVNGYLVQSVEDACQAVGNLANIDRKECRKRADEHFSVSSVVPQYERLYGELLAHA